MVGLSALTLRNFIHCHFDSALQIVCSTYCVKANKAAQLQFTWLDTEPPHNAHFGRRETKLKQAETTEHAALAHSKSRKFQHGSRHEWVLKPPCLLLTEPHADYCRTSFEESIPDKSGHTQGYFHLPDGVGVSGSGSISLMLPLVGNSMEGGLACLEAPGFGCSGELLLVPLPVIHSFREKLLVASVRGWSCWGPMGATNINSSGVPITPFGSPL